MKVFLIHGKKWGKQVMVLEYLTFEHPESLAIGVFIIIFAVANYALVKFIRNRGTSLLISFLIGLIVAWKLYTERFYGWEGTLAFVLIVIAIAIFLKIFLAFFRNFRRSSGN